VFKSARRTLRATGIQDSICGLYCLTRFFRSLVAAGLPVSAGVPGIPSTAPWADAST